jgi:hypothetical protein
MIRATVTLKDLVAALLAHLVPLLNDGVHQPRAQDYNCRHMRLDGAESAKAREPEDPEFDGRAAMMTERST